MRSKNQHLDWKYNLVFLVFHGIHALFLGYMLVIIGSKGLTDSQVGVSLSIGSALSMFLPLLPGKFSDDHPEISLRRTLVICLMVTAGLMSILWKFELNTLLVTVLFGIRHASVNVLVVLYNSLGMRYENAGASISYGRARGLGAVGYAVFSYLGGLIVTRFGAEVLMIVNIAMLALSAVMVAFLPNETGGISERSIVAKKRGGKSYISILFSGTMAILFFMIVALFNFSIKIDETYLLRFYENVGGTVQQYGLGTSIAAIFEVPMMLFSHKLCRKLGSRKVICLMFVGRLVQIILMIFAASPELITVLRALSFSTTGIFHVVLVTEAHAIAGENETVKVQTLYTGIACGLGVIIASYFGGYCLTHWGVRATLMGTCAATCLGLFMAIIYAINKNNNTKAEEKNHAEGHNF